MLIYYWFRYFTVILLGYFIKFIGLPSIYSLSYLIYIPYNFLVLSYGFFTPLRKRKDGSYYHFLKPYLLLTSLSAFLFIYVITSSFKNALFYTVVNSFELYFIKPSFVKQEKETLQNIANYFKNKGK